jgi:pimeloyl-ACP methyl ester carboxylesterase
VGHSLGCQIAAEVAARRPELVSGLLLVGPTSDAGGRTVRQQLARAVAGSMFDRPSYLIWTTRDYCRAGVRLVTHEMREMIAHRIETLLPRISAPVRVVRGGRDLIVPRRWAATVASRAGAPAPTTLPGWGHAVQYDDPAGVTRVALAVAGLRSHP